MKQKYAIMMKWSIFVIITVLAIHCLTPYYANRKAKDYRYRAFQNMQDNPDVWIMGTSVTEMGVIPNQLYEDYGITAFNLSVAMQQIDTTEFVLDSFLKEKTPKVIVISTDGINIQDKPATNCVETMALREIKGNSLKKLSYMYDHFGFRFAEYVKFYFPALLFHEDLLNNEIKDQRDDDIEQLGQLFTKGYKYSAESEKVKLADQDCINQIDMNAESVEHLKNVVDMCQERGIQVVFVEIPSEFDFSYSDYLQTNFADCGYVNFTQLRDEIGLNPDCDYFDTVHLSMSGASKVTDYLGAFLTEQYGLEDHRTQNENSIWDITLDANDKITYDTYNNELWKEHLDKSGYVLDSFLK